MNSDMQEHIHPAMDQEDVMPDTAEVFFCFEEDKFDKVSYIVRRLMSLYINDSENILIRYYY